MSSFSRRDFIKASVAGALAVPGVAALAQDAKKTPAPKKNASSAGKTSAAAKKTTSSANLQPAGANGDIRLCVVGFNGKGGHHIQGFSRLKGVRLVALCDADSKVISNKVNEFQKNPNNSIRVETYTDIRKMLENKDIDVVTIATPNHWHSLMAIWALQAGKDVYVEKPVSHYIWEGRRLVEAAQKYGRIIQAGTQKRSDEALADAIERLKKGELGKIKLVRGLCYKRRASIGKTEGPQPIPPSVDYDLWCGPAPKDPLRRKRLHYDWHWFWNTGNGDIGNQGIHEMDVARWAAGHTAIAPRVMSIGGRFGYDDDAETPNTEIAFFDYPDIPMIFEVYGLPIKADIEAMPNYKSVSVGNVVHCENGYFSGGWFYDNDGKQIKQIKLDGGGRAFQNFINAVRSRKAADVKAPILEGHLSSALCHMGNIPYRLGKALKPEEVKERIKSDKEAMETYERMMKHLAANNVDLGKADHVIGPWLKMNPQTELFEGALADEANRLGHGTYRAPFVVPEKF